MTDLERLAKRIQDTLTGLGTWIENFNEAGGQFNLRVHTDDGESFDLHQLTGEFEGTYFKIEEIKP